MAIFRGDFSSAALGMYTGINVIIPESGALVSEKPVLFLLHGLSDNYTNWVARTNVEMYAYAHDCVVVMPEVQRSFYTDMVYGLNYYTYVSDELPKRINAFFNTTLEPRKTYVGGLSMGGYGALKCALTYPERYAGAMAFSSACDMEANIPFFAQNDQATGEMKGIFGTEMKLKPEGDLFYLMKGAAKSEIKPKFFVTCGTSDFLLEQNRKFRDGMKAEGLDLHYEEWEGDHNWTFWDESIKKSMNYFFKQ